MKTRIAIADDHRIFSEGITRILNGNAEMIWIADSGSEVQNQLERDLPDVLLLDINLKDANGLVFFEQIRKNYPRLKVIALTMYDDHYVVNRAWELGFDGFLLKNTSPNELSEAVTTVLNNGRHFKGIIEQILDAKRNLPFDLSGIRITEREREIIGMLASGLNTQEIGEKLFLSPHTVDTHRKNLLRKLDLSNTAALVRFAYDNGII